jgi:hypothetical protein
MSEMIVETIAISIVFHSQVWNDQREMQPSVTES